MPCDDISHSGDMGTLEEACYACADKNRHFNDCCQVDCDKLECPADLYLFQDDEKCEKMGFADCDSIPWPKGQSDPNYQDAYYACDIVEIGLGGCCPRQCSTLLDLE